MAVLVGLFEISVDRYLTVVKKRALRGNKKTVQNLFVLNLDYVRGLRDSLAQCLSWNHFSGIISHWFFVNYFSELTATDKAFQGVTFTVFLLAFCFFAFTSYRILHTSAADQESFEQIKITSRRSIKSEFTMIIINCSLFLVFNTINCSSLQMRKELLSSLRGWKLVFDSFFED